MQIKLSKSLIAVLLGAGPHKAAARLPSKDRRLTRQGPFAVVANRNSGSVSFIAEGNAGCDGVTTVHISGSEPMYVNANEDNIFVGDRGNNAILVFDPADVLNPNSIHLDENKCEGLFHQWLNDEFFVATCTGTKSVVRLELSDFIPVLDYIDLDDLGDCVPHDIVINESNEIFVTTVGGCNSNQIIKINAEGTELERIDVGAGADPHVALYPGDDVLYSPQQGNNVVAVYDQSDLSEVQSLAVPNAHGICFSPDGNNLFVTDINGGKSLIEIAPKQGDDDAELTGAEAAITERGVAHNCAVAESGKIFVTHSGPAAEFVTLFRTKGNKNGRMLVNDGSFLSDPYGSNPFGIGIFDGDIGGLP